jgi:predicted membrane-bound spermidine synthase
LLQAPADGVEAALRDEPGGPGTRDTMIVLHLAQTDRGEVSVALHGQDGTVGYYRDGLLQTLINAQGQNLAGYVEAAVERICGQGAQRVLVLGHGGGAASTLLHRRGIEVTSVDVDPLAERLGQLFFRAPPTLSVVTAEAAAFVAASPAATFDAVFVDFQDSATPPADYLAPAFWRQVARVLRPRGQVIIVNVTNYLWDGPDWPACLEALGAAGLVSAPLDDVYDAANFLMVATGAP